MGIGDMINPASAKTLLAHLYPNTPNILSAKSGNIVAVIFPENVGK